MIPQGEFRTCVVTFSSAEQAAAARTALQHHQGPGWTAPILINFVKQDPRDPHQGQYLSQSVNGEMIHDRDSLGNTACATLFVKNLAPSMSSEQIRGLFPTAVKILAGTKELKPGEFRTAYISFESIPAAVAARHHMTGYINNEQTTPLIINYSVRPQDQPKSTMPSVGFPGIHYGVNNLGYGDFGFAPGFDYGHTRGSGGVSGFAAPFGGFGAEGFASSSAFRNFGARQNLPSPISIIAGETLPGFSVVDMFDSKGHPATNTLFIDCLPYDVRESTLRYIFGNTVGFRGMQMGNKILQPNEYRTAVVYYNHVENAVRARGQLQYHREHGWSRPLIIHYVKH